MNELEYPILVLKAKISEFDVEIDKAKNFNRIKAPSLSTENFCDCRIYISYLEQHRKTLISAVSILENHGAAKNSA